ncbi:hypothetical protein GCM10009839_41370 [Catenulispora yoronensis]|uniref:Trypsin-co-occurring domain-containing protein n=1 Tax=Catenulispora yoronensis TaxID=450799 RepID=A0ABN2UGE1_9ACTN
MAELLEILLPGGVVYARVEVAPGEDVASLAEVDVPVAGGGGAGVGVGADDLETIPEVGDVGVRNLFRKVKKLADFKETIQHVAVSVHESFAALEPEKVPDKVAVEFSIEIAAKSGQLVGVVAEAGTKAALKVSVEWTGMAARVAADAAAKQKKN